MQRDINPSWESELDLLYTAVGNEHALSEALGRWRDVFGAQQVLMQTLWVAGPFPGANISSCGVPSEGLLEYHTHYETEDVWAKEAVRRNLIFPGSVARGASLVPPAQLHRSRFWREFLSRYEVTDMLSGVIEVPAAPGNLPTVVTFHRTGTHGQFPPEHEPLLAALLPHLRRVLGLHRRLTPQIAIGRSLHDLFEHMDMPMLMVDSQARLVGANSAARAQLNTELMLREGPGGALQFRAEERWCELSGELSRLALRKSSERLLTDMQGHARVLCVQRAHGAFTDRLLQHPAQAVLSLRDLSLPRDLTLVRRRFDLTETESQVAAWLSKGLDAQLIADELGVKLTTVRTHIAQLLQKTGCNRQVEMLARLQGR